jgi:hypothetical protein
MKLYNEVEHIMSLKKEIYRCLYFLFSLIALIICINIILTPDQLRAYKSLPADPTALPKLPGSATVLTIFYEHLNSALGIQNSGTHAVDALNQWNVSSTYIMFDSLSADSVTQSQNRILATLFSLYVTPTPCGYLFSTPSYTAAVGCPGNISIYLDTDDIAWNTNDLNGTYAPWSLSCLCYPIYADFRSVILHEIGHLFGLAHNNSTTSVMRAGYHGTRILTEDDKRGATQIYGPDTDFEVNYPLNWFPGYTYTSAQGLTNVGAYVRTVTSPQLFHVSAENGATPYSGSKQIKLQGTANSNYSYAYMLLFRAADDELGSNSRHLTIANGMKLHWYQRNHIQSRMTVDIAFTDGTVLRDTGLKDQNNVGVHPAARGSYSVGVWYFFTVDLSPLAGKRVQDIMIAYDNGNNGPTGVFRAYFDNIEINY